jgi:TnsA endonuclease N terminal
MTDANHLGNLSTFRLRRRTPGSFLLVPCPKQGRSIRCQGQLEAATAVILIACPQVVHVQEQPLTIWYAWRGTEGSVEIQLLDGPPTSPCKREKGAGISYIVPDFLVEMADGNKRLVEVKPSQRLDRPIAQRKLAVGRLFAAQEGWTFHVVTEKELLPGPLLNNVRLLNRYRQGRMDPGVLEQLVLQVPSGGIGLAGLLSGDDPAQHAYLRMHILHLLSKSRLNFDPYQRPLDDQTLIFPGGVISWDPFDSLWAPSGSSTGGPGGSSAS